jgi:hypothetical protein
MKIILEDQLKTTFITPWWTFCYKIMSFGLYNALRTFQHFWTRFLNHSWAFLYEFSLTILKFIMIELLILSNLN